ncbi:MAG: hypothetical protein HFJ48_01615 [Clostridia bacterium]|nr:hypothetical protein [Clostridia bacterium]
MTYHCLFEQSGTFKKEFKKLGYDAYDYDIQNEFNETDYVCDLFTEIEKAYDNKKSIFDNIKKEDTIIAFFPCIRFEDQIQMYFRGNACRQKNWSYEQKLEYDLKLHSELSQLYEMITKLAIVCIKRKIPLIIENPYSSTHYLVKYWSIPNSIIDKDRTLRGDYYKKPTQYWFINRKPSQNMVLEAYTIQNNKIVENIHNKTERSMISSEYANRFIREFIL